MQRYNARDFTSLPQDRSDSSNHRGTKRYPSPRDQSRNSAINPAITGQICKKSVVAGRVAGELHESLRTGRRSGHNSSRAREHWSQSRNKIPTCSRARSDRNPATTAGSTLERTATTAAPNKHQPPTLGSSSCGAQAEALFSERLYGREITYIFNGHAWPFAGPYDFTSREMCSEGARKKAPAERNSLSGARRNLP